MSSFEDEDLLEDDLQWKDVSLGDDELDVAEEEALLRVSDDEVNLLDSTGVENDIEYVDEDGNPVDMSENVNADIYEIKEEYDPHDASGNAEDDGVVLGLSQDEDILEVDIDGDLDGVQSELDDSIINNDYPNPKRVAPVRSRLGWHNDHHEVMNNVLLDTSDLADTDKSDVADGQSVSVEQEKVVESSSPHVDVSETPVPEEGESKASNVEDESDEESDDRRERFRSERKSVVLKAATRRTDIPDSLESVIPEEESAKVDEFLAKERERKLQKKGLLRPRGPFRAGPPFRQPGACIVPLLPSGNRGEIPIQPVHPTPQQQQQQQQQLRQQQNQHFSHHSGNGPNAFMNLNDTPDHFMAGGDASNAAGGRKILINPHFRGPRPNVSQGILPHPMNNALHKNSPSYNDPPFLDIPPHLRGLPPDHPSNFRDFIDGSNNGILNQRPPLTFRNFNPRFPPPMRDRPLMNAFERPPGPGIFNHPPRSMGPAAMHELQPPRFLNVPRLQVQQIHGMELQTNLYTPFDSPSNKCHPTVSENWRMPSNPPTSIHEMSHPPPNQPFQHRPPFHPPNSNIIDHSNNGPFGNFQPRTPFNQDFGGPLGANNNNNMIRNPLSANRMPHPDFINPHGHQNQQQQQAIRPLMDNPSAFQMNAQMSMENKPAQNQHSLFQQNFNNRNHMFNEQQRSPHHPQQSQYPKTSQTGNTLSPGQKRPLDGFQAQVSPLKQARIEPRKIQRKVAPINRKPAVRSSNIKEVPLSESLPVPPTPAVSVPQAPLTSSATTTVAAEKPVQTNALAENKTENTPLTSAAPSTASLLASTSSSTSLPTSTSTSTNAAVPSSAPPAAAPKDDDEDDETRELRRKIEEQKKLREEIIRRKEERRRQMAAQRLKELQERLKEQEQEQKIPVTVKNCPVGATNVPAPAPLIEQQQQQQPVNKPSVKCRLGYQGQPKPVINPAQGLLTAKKRVIVVRKKPPQVPLALQNSGLQQNKNLISVNPPGGLANLQQHQQHQPRIIPGLNHRSVIPPHPPSSATPASSQIKNLQTTKVLEHIKQMSQNRTNRQQGLQFNNQASNLRSNTIIFQKNVAGNGNIKQQQITPLQQIPSGMMQRNLGLGRGCVRGLVRPQKMIQLNPQHQQNHHLHQQRLSQPSQIARLAGASSSSVQMQPRSCHVLVENLAASTTESQLSKLCSSVGPVQSIQMQSADRKAVVTFNNAIHAIQFQKKYQRFMLDLSMIQVSLVGQ